MGLRELKKERTRKAISDMATTLFIERGYHEVTTAEIAERAQVSVPTLFKYFPTKESLVFDEDLQMEEWLVNIVLDRKKDQSVLEALYEGGLRKIEEIPNDHKKNFKRFITFIETTPELSLYSKQMWMRHTKALAVVIRKQSKKKMELFEAEAIARYVLDSYHRSLGTPNPKATLKALFKILEKGWIQ